jgi:hypothetical protein
MGKSVFAYRSEVLVITEVEKKKSLSTSGRSLKGKL